MKTTAELLKQNAKMRALLRAIAYPKRGTAEEQMTIQGAADQIQATFTLEQLEPLEPDQNLENLDAAHARMWHSEARRLAQKYNEKTFYN